MEVYLNGEYVPQEEAKISVFDHGFLYGDGVFEGIRAYNSVPFKLKEHVDRLYNSARTICLEIPISKDQMSQVICEAVKRNSIKDGYIRVVVSRGAGTLGLDIERTSNPQVIVIADRITLYPDEIYENGLDIVTASTIRNHPQAINPRVKSLNYLNNILAKIEGKRAGCIEALMLNHLGQVAECTADNIFIANGSGIHTPPCSSGALEGITRQTVMDLASEAGYEVHESVLTRHDLYIADECFLTGTAAEIIAVVKLDNRPIGTGKPGPIFQELRTRFNELTAKS